MNKPAANHLWPIGKFALTGVLTLIILIAGFGTWLANANLSGAIIVRGQVSHTQETHEIQHLSGGTVSAVNVTEGDMVQAGDILIKLGDPGLQSDLKILNTRLNEVAARRSRLMAQRDNKSVVAFPPKLTEIALQDVGLRQLLAGQSRLFNARQKSLAQERVANTEKTRQFTNQISGIDAQLDALDIQHQLISRQAADQQQLLNKNLTTAGSVLALRREVAIIQGEIGAAIAGKAAVQAQISQVDIEYLRAASQRREDAITQLRDLEFRLSELSEQRSKLLSQIEALEIRAPIGGVVLGLGRIATNTVVKPAHVLMQIVPVTPPDRIIARVAPVHIDRLSLSQPVDIRFPSGTGNETPNTGGTITGISAAALDDPITGVGYFRVEIRFSSGVPAMVGITTDQPVDIFIRTSDQPAWAYLAKPFLNYFSRALRES